MFYKPTNIIDNLTAVLVKSSPGTLPQWWYQNSINNMHVEQNVKLLLILDGQKVLISDGEGRRRKENQL